MRQRLPADTMTCLKGTPRRPSTGCHPQRLSDRTSSGAKDLGFSGAAVENSSLTCRTAGSSSTSSATRPMFPIKVHNGTAITSSDAPSASNRDCSPHLASTRSMKSSFECLLTEGRRRRNERSTASPYRRSPHMAFHLTPSHEERLSQTGELQRSQTTSLMRTLPTHSLNTFTLLMYVRSLSHPPWGALTV